MTPIPESAVRGADKKVLRAHYAALRDSLQGEARAAAETAIRHRLFDLPAWREAPLICSYVSMRGEIDTDPIREQASREGKGYALPVTVTGTREGRMIFRRVEAPDSSPLVTARFGIPEPDETCPPLSPRDFVGAMILVPGLVFDDGGFRLGYGGGYYDRFLAALKNARIPVTAVGMVFSHCRAASLPREAFDIPVDCVIDENSTHIL